VAVVVLLIGVNVGGHRTFRPSVLAEQLQHLAAVNIGAAGTFVIRRSVPRAQLRVESGCCPRITSRTSPRDTTSSAS
jgi:ABC-type phosphate transport system auxiliary subunit